MDVAADQLAEAFARTACQALVDQLGVERAYREAVALLTCADEELRAMYLEIMMAMDTIHRRFP